MHQDGVAVGRRCEQQQRERDGRNEGDGRCHRVCLITILGRLMPIASGSPRVGSSAGAAAGRSRQVFAALLQGRGGPAWR